MGAKMLSKSRFKLAIECPTKVYYSLDRRYVDARDDDEFLQALADGGFQVGELAKRMFRAEDPDAVEITTRDQEAQLAETAALLALENVTIFEATVRHGDCLVRVDVLRKRGTVVELIEVKAKSWDPIDDSLTGQGPRANPIAPEWEPYVYDVAFQQRVLARAYPHWTVRPSLLLVDTSRRNSVPGLGLWFPVTGPVGGRRAEAAEGFDVGMLREPLLVRVDASEAVRIAHTQVRRRRGRPDLVFDSLVETSAAAIVRGDRLGPYVGPACKSCEFYCPPELRDDSRRSGWAECMETRFRAAVSGPREETVFGFYGAASTTDQLDRGRLWMREVAEAELGVKESRERITPTARHRLQWREIVHRDAEPFVNVGPLRAPVENWQFPLHFIDFETAAPALPFHVGQRPYQPILFQFSHHVVQNDGRARHASECLVVDGESSPSIEVVRRLRAAIGGDNGTVLHWYPHERTILGKVRQDIVEAAPRDAADLLAFLDGLGLEKDSHLRLFDLGRLVADQVFLAGTGGSSSMKKFLPAVLRQSQTVRGRYAQPIYGTAAFPSHNFRDQRWVVERNGVPLDPYELLSPLFGEHDLDEALARLETGEGDVIANGAAAMIAYGRLLDPARDAAEREALRRQLLRYCELDTLAMVMVYEALKAWIAK